MPKAAKPGWQKLLDDLDEIEKRFKDPKFKGTFDMGHFGLHKGHHKPAKDNYCGTSACLAGWLVTLGKHEFRVPWIGVLTDSFVLPVNAGWGHHAQDVYGVSWEEAHKLFYEAPTGLAGKLKQARQFANAVKRRETKQQKEKA